MSASVLSESDKTDEKIGANADVAASVNSSPTVSANQAEQNITADLNSTSAPDHVELANASDSTASACGSAVAANSVPSASSETDQLAANTAHSDTVNSSKIIPSEASPETAGASTSDLSESKAQTDSDKPSTLDQGRTDAADEPSEAKEQSNIDREESNTAVTSEESHSADVTVGNLPADQSSTVPEKAAGPEDASQNLSGEEANNDEKYEGAAENVGETASDDDTEQFVDAKSPTQIDEAASVESNRGESSVGSKEADEQEAEEYLDEEEEGPDDDEIESNPAYIPKSGRYYMHDSRNTNEEDVQKASIRSRADGKWKHDRFDERSQAPKTRRELLSRYGYDIRSERGDATARNRTTHQTSVVRSRGGRGRDLNRRPPSQDYKRGMKQPVENYRGTRGAPRTRRFDPVTVGNRRSGRGVTTNTRVFKTSPNAGSNRGASGRPGNQRYSPKDNGVVRENRERPRDTNAVHGGDQRRGGHAGGKRYSTQRLTTSYPEPPVPSAPVPIPPEWHAPTFQSHPTLAPPLAVPAPVPNFNSSDIVYFDPQQQLYRNPPQPRAKKRLEIVPPIQTKNSN